MSHWWDCIYRIRIYDKEGRIISEEKVKNIMVDEGANLAIEVLLRKSDSIFIPEDKFYIGLYHGAISRTTTLATIPGEPNSSGYSRQPIERSNIGWPIKEKDPDGYWRLLSKEVSFTASGGTIGPISGAFLCTVGSGSSGYLISTVSASVERTIFDSETMGVSLWVRCR